jgi:hypothetical protein
MTHIVGPKLSEKLAASGAHPIGGTFDGCLPLPAPAVMSAHRDNLVSRNHL